MSVSLITQRVFFNSTDISIATADYRVGTYAITYTTPDYIYIGSSTPFNNLWMELSTVSGASAGSPSVQVWYARAWTNVVDIIDQTAGMTASGRVSWELEIFKGWDIEQKSSDVTGLSSTNIYDKYWLRLSWPNAFTAGVGFIGQKFSDDTVLQGHYPDLLQPAILEGYKTGKTNWNEQHFMAAEAIVKDLRKRNILQDKGQIFDWTVFEEASVHKLAEIVYSAFGTAYREHALEAHKKYNSEMANKILVIDENKDGRVDSMETKASQGWMTR